MARLHVFPAADSAGEEFRAERAALLDEWEEHLASREAKSAEAVETNLDGRSQVGTYRREPAAGQIVYGRSTPIHVPPATT